ncbi:MAG: 4-hydroxy-tetrahydrodipicolinate synthase [Firmicutes bacterium]|nr:4-hydroxy-tetrahydrodipicolinate synthase [Bacillota bacterium]
MEKVLFEGVSVALVTPFKNGAIDFDALGKIVEYQIAGGIRTFIVLGTTAETATLSIQEQNEIITFVRTVINGRAKIIVGTGSNNTVTTINRSLEVKALGGIDGLLVVTPYYNKATQAGLVTYFTQIADSVKMPMIVYNVPGRTGLNMSVDTVVKLCENPYIVGLKEASGNVPQLLELVKALDGKLAIYSGEDAFDFLFYTLGCAGSISVTANVLPLQKVELFNLVRMGKITQARELHNRLLDANNEMFCEPNPIPVKAGLCFFGLCSDEMRSPLTTIEEHNRRKLVNALQQFKN